MKDKLWLVLANEKVDGSWQWGCDNGDDDDDDDDDDDGWFRQMMEADSGAVIDKVEVGDPD